MNNETIAYYNKYSLAFIESTQKVDFSAMQNVFMKYLPTNAKILDFGCGSGRDTKYFMEQGYQVEAIDGSKELCRQASAYTGITVRHMFFQELNEVKKYDGIWACASILHLKKTELTDVLYKMTAALKEQGIIYTSFKYGTFEGIRNGRYFTDFTESTFNEFIKSIRVLGIEKQWITGDVRSGRADEKWLNLLLKKRSIW